MTQMSDLHHPDAAVFPANCPDPQGQSRVARPLHISALLVIPLLFIASAGCVLPPTLGVEQQDAGTNSPPAITSVRIDLQDLAEPGPITVKIGSMAGSLTLGLIDTDLGDTLYPKIFVDYNSPDPTPPRSTCTQSASDTAERGSTCPLAGVCTSTLTGTHLLTIVVFDRPVLETGVAPLYQAMPTGGLATNRTYLLTCQ
ncbi:MAG: hypothetical protein JWO36_5194 [Myxococcales bacterium]|nr:hypothetical protein [Myxococcales bacterium]